MESGGIGPRILNYITRWMNFRAWPLYPWDKPPVAFSEGWMYLTADQAAKVNNLDQSICYNVCVWDGGCTLMEIV